MRASVFRALTWYYRQYRAADFKIGGNVVDKYRWNWFFARFTVVYPWLAGFSAHALTKPFIPLFGLPEDFDSLTGLIVGGSIIVYLIACWIITAMKGPKWAYAKD